MTLRSRTLNKKIKGEPFRKRVKEYLLLDTEFVVSIDIILTGHRAQEATWKFYHDEKKPRL